MFAGDTLRSETECTALRESKSRPNAGIVTWAHRSFNQRDELVCECTAHRLAPQAARMSAPRSWLFVPADSEKKVAKAIASEADAIIFDLEDSVAPAQKAAARDILKGLRETQRRPGLVGAHQSARAPTTIKRISACSPRPISKASCCPRPKAAPTSSSCAHTTGHLPIHAIVTETAASLFGLMSYREPSCPLAAMSWGAEDLSAALGASSKYDADGSLAFTYRLARSLCLAGAVAAGVQPVDGVFADFRDEEGLRAEAEAARREGFTGKLAIHPSQVAVINAAFTPSADEIAHAEAVVAAFEAHPDAGVLSVDGKMVDRPHLSQAMAVLARARPA